MLARTPILSDKPQTTPIRIRPVTGRAPTSAEMLQAEARVWAQMMQPLEDLIGDRAIDVVMPDPRISAALDEIDFGALREFLEIVGRPAPA